MAEQGQLLKEFLSLVDIEEFEEKYSKDITDESYFGRPLQCIVDAEKRLRSGSDQAIAYFSMEYGLASSFYNTFRSQLPVSTKNKIAEHEVFSNHRLADYFFTLTIDNILDMPIYSGGLGVLAGDTVKTMADYKLPVAAVGILWNTGYFRQRLWFKYGQFPEEMQWDPHSYPGLVPLKNRITIALKNETITLRLWKYYVFSYGSDYAVPLILLDANIQANQEKNRHLTDQLYRSDNVWLKIMQRVILGMGGVAALAELGYLIDTHHLNEGHAIFSFLAKARGLNKEQVEDLKKHFVYTCHTPVEAGHDRFFIWDLEKILTPEDLEIMKTYGRERQDTINLTLLSINVSSMVNAVSLNHQKVMHIQFPKYKDLISYVTNGVHPHTWISDDFKRVFEKYHAKLGDFRANPMALAKVKELKNDSDFRKLVWEAHQENKQRFCAMLDKWRFSKDTFTICWARRIAAYKRPSLILQDITKLADIAKRVGPLQVVIAGKAHPNDRSGFTFINEMLDKVDNLTESFDTLKIVMLENYEISLARLLTSGVDVWLNNPLPPFEASGTSGMKAILNAVLQLSTIDGWVAEATNSNIGILFGYQNEEGALGSEHDLHMHDDAEKLYASLEKMVELYYRTNTAQSVQLSSAWIDTMIDCIAAGAHFNTYRMLDEYKNIVWRREQEVKV